MLINKVEDAVEVHEQLPVTSCNLPNDDLPVSSYKLPDHFSAALPTNRVHCCADVEKYSIRQAQTELPILPCINYLGRGCPNWRMDLCAKSERGCQ